MKRSKKMQANLAARLKDYGETMNTRSKEAVVQQRKETGGYHKPGSNKK